MARFLSSFLKCRWRNVFYSYFWATFRVNEISLSDIFHEKWESHLQYLITFQQKGEQDFFLQIPKSTENVWLLSIWFGTICWWIWPQYLISIDSESRCWFKFYPFWLPNHFLILIVHFQREKLHHPACGQFFRVKICLFVSRHSKFTFQVDLFISVFLICRSIAAMFSVWCCFKSIYESPTCGLERCTWDVYYARVQNKLVNYLYVTMSVMVA